MSDRQDPPNVSIVMSRFVEYRGDLIGIASSHEQQLPIHPDVSPFDMDDIENEDVGGPSRQPSPGASAGSSPSEASMRASCDGRSSSVGTHVSERSSDPIENHHGPANFEMYNDHTMFDQLSSVSQSHGIVPNGITALARPDIIQELESSTTLMGDLVPPVSSESEIPTPGAITTPHQSQIVAPDDAEPSPPAFIMSPEGVLEPRFARCGCLNMAYIRLQQLGANLMN